MRLRGRTPSPQVGDVVSDKPLICRLAARWCQRDDLFESAFAHSAIGMAVVSPSGWFLRVNPAFCRITAYAEGQLLAMSYRDITHPEDLRNDDALYAELKAGHRDSYQMLKRYQRAPRGTGAYFWVRLTVSLIRRGRESLAIAQIEDVDREQRSRKELEDRLHELQAIALARSSDLPGRLDRLAAEWAARDELQRPDHA